MLTMTRSVCCVSLFLKYVYLIVTGAYSVTPYLVFCKKNSSETDTTPHVTLEQLSRVMNKVSKLWALLKHGGVSTTTSGSNKDAPTNYFRHKR